MTNKRLEELNGLKKQIEDLKEYLTTRLIRTWQRKRKDTRCPLQSLQAWAWTRLEDEE